MMRYTAVAVCLLALAAGSLAAGPLDGQCTASYIKMEYVAPALSPDPMAKCLTSVRLDLDVDCGVTLTALQSHGSHVPGIWTSAPLLLDTSLMVECPVDGKRVQAVTGSGDKLEAVRRATIKAFASFVYGLDAYDQYNFELEVPDLDFFPGKLIVKRVDALNLVYAITESTVLPTDMLQDDDITPIYEVPDCQALDHNNPIYSAFSLCLPNESADTKCPDNSYGIMVVNDPYVNAWDMQIEAFKVCGWCPAGTAGDGFGCTTCQAGQFSVIGGGCQDCPAGTYANAGSSTCLPCPTGTYSDAVATKECTECPEDTYSWIPGSTACLRCISGIPQECPGGVCPSDPVVSGVMKSTQATTIVSVDAMGAEDGTCNFNAANPDYEIKAFTKCKGWGSVMQFAFTVYGDCSIQISPISDPSCSIPTDNVTYEYGAIQQRAYYAQDGAGGFKISSLFDTTRDVVKSVMLNIVSAGGGKLDAKWYAATTDAMEGQTNFLIADKPGPEIPEVCTASLTVTGGLILNEGTDPTAGPWTCPAGSFYSGAEVCPICPVGFTCPGGPAGPQTKVPCGDNTYNDMLGLSDPCTICPNGTTPGTYTSYAAAEMCAVERVDLECKTDTTASYAYDKASQQCQLCPAGTERVYTGASASLECTACDAGSFSAEGGFCTVCPIGQYSPSQGLADQTSITGIQCILCAEGSMPLTTGNASLTAVPTNGSTYCDACPSGSVLPDQTQACQLCDQDTYRAGDATPENNVCKPVPAGYKLADDSHASINLCPAGTVSFYDNGDQTFGTRVPFNDELNCIACSALDSGTGAATGSGGPGKWAHTFASRKGMTQCVPCPAGTIPKNTADGRTTSCVACPNGFFRDAYKVAAVCDKCGPGNEVGPSSKMACTQCRPGSYMPTSRTIGTGTDTNTCDLCPKYQYRPTFGATSCLLCPRGTTTSNTGNVECTACPIGYYNNQAGVACSPAPTGTFVNTTGAFVSTPCPMGSWNNEQAQDNCNPCAPGKYANTLGSKECKTCAAGTYSAGQATSCINCRPGYAAPAGAASCSPCKPGTYAPDSKSATCKLCPKGFQCPTNAMRMEGPCPRGTFSNKEGNRLCTPCPINTYSLGGGTAASPSAVMACVKCAPGTNTRGLVGQSRCQVIRPQVKRLF